MADSGSAREVRRAAELLGLSNLLVGLESFTSGELYLSDQVEKKIREERQARLRTLALSPDNFLTGQFKLRYISSCVNDHVCRNRSVQLWDKNILPLGHIPKTAS